MDHSTEEGTAIYQKNVESFKINLIITDQFCLQKHYLEIF